MGDGNGKDLIAEITELRDKAGKYEVFKQDRVELSEKISRIANDLLGIAKIIDPMKLKISKAGSQRDHSEHLNLFKDKMMSGVQVTRKLIESTYPDLEAQKVSYLITMIKKMPNVSSAKDGKAVRLFMTKET